MAQQGLLQGLQDIIKPYPQDNYAYISNWTCTTTSKSNNHSWALLT